MRLVVGKVEQTGEKEAPGGVVTISGEWFINPGFWLLNRVNVIGRSRRWEWGVMYIGDWGMKGWEEEVGDIDLLFTIFEL
jgi:hypothetical protein